MSTSSRMSASSREEAAAPVTSIAVVLDETGSMAPSRDATIRGFNQWLRAQQSDGAACTLTLTLFSLKADAPVCRVRCRQVPLAEVKPLRRTTYRPAGNTPLHDAIGHTLTALDGAAPAADRYLVVILTDGLENASRTYTGGQIQDMIREREATGRWTFVFLGANQDAVAAGEAIGASGANSASFDVADIDSTFATLSAATRSYRSGHARRSGTFWSGGRPR